MSSKVSLPEENLFLAMREELSSASISARLKLVVLSQTPEKRRFPMLEAMTGVPENTWRTWWKRGGIPSGALVEGVARTWPEYAFWMATGLTDVEFGHRIPPLHISVVGYVSNFPEGKLKKDRVWAAEYFKICKDIQDASPKDNDYAERNSILKSMMRLVAEKRRAQICEGIDIDLHTGDEKR